ncbi:transposase [Sphaerisporangium sp. NBC_01403]|uniref:transposase n=1 Tax=Sphaerisporangium sp. NBC_01403 TaxID=2903599 RepID=UPI00324A4E02
MGAVERLDEIPGISPQIAQVILAEVGLDMACFATAGHLASWAKLCPRTIQSGPKEPGRQDRQGQPLPEGRAGNRRGRGGRTDSFLGERYRRIVKRRGKLKALVAVARSILVIVWHLLADPTARYRDLGSDYHANKIDRARRPAPTSGNSKHSGSPSL